MIASWEARNSELQINVFELKEQKYISYKVPVESLDSQVRGATTHPPHPWSLWLVNHFPQALLVVL